MIETKNQLRRSDCSLKEVAHLNCSQNMYGIILAAGNGKRMAEYIKHFYGTDLPKQYVAFTGKRSMVQHTLKRAGKMIPKERILLVIDSNHQEIIKEQFNDHPGKNVICQPINRETAPGILLPLSYIYKIEPRSSVAIFPSDHFILEEDRFMEYIGFAQKVIDQFPDKIILLGVQADYPEEEYGWIQPGERILEQSGFEVNRVERFYEKPNRILAQTYFNQGHLWNTLIMVTRCSTLWNLAKESLPGIHEHFEKIRAAIGTFAEEEMIFQEYEKMERATISHDVLEKYPDRLLVLKVKDVFWNDWGNGMRVLETLNRIGKTANIIVSIAPNQKNTH